MQFLRVVIDVTRHLPDNHRRKQQTLVEQLLPLGAVQQLLFDHNRIHFVLVGVKNNSELGVGTDLDLNRLIATAG